ncbi:unnamed protein product, partial [Polarella glacialis]
VNERLAAGVAATEKSLGEAGQYLKEAKDKATVLGGYAMKGMKTKKQATWNTRFWLLMIDIRTLALTIEHDLSTLRSLTDAAGKPVGWAVAGDMQSKEVTAGGIRCVWVWPKEVEDPLLVPGKLLYVHGGAFCLGSPETHKQLAQQLSRRSKAAVLLPDYRRCPESTVGDALADCVAVYQWLVTSIAEAKQSGDAGLRAKEAAKEVVVGGESAGANLALGLALKVRAGIVADVASSKVNLSMPGGLMLLSPWTDLKDSIEQRNNSWTENEELDFVLPELAELFSRWVLWAQKTGGLEGFATDKAANAQAEALSKEELLSLASSQEVSPARATSLAGLPRTLVTIGAGETLRDSQLELVERLRQEKCQVESEVFPDMPHAFVLAHFM